MDFFELFEQSEFKPIIYKDKLIQLGDELPCPPIKEFTITFESVSSEWQQGIILASKRAHFQLNRRIEKLNSIFFWHGEVPSENTLKILKAGRKPLSIWNMWRIDNGPMQYGHNGAAMHVQTLANGRRYHCNDGYPDEDFDDLIFRVTWSS